jgi:hypothetical protein
MARAKKVEMEEGTEELTQERLICIADLIGELNEKKKEIAAAISDAIKDFAAQHGIKGKELKRGIAAYEAWKTNPEEFNSSSFLVDKIIEMLTGEKCVTFITEKEFNGEE